MNNRVVVGLLSTLLLSGCATSAISVEEAKKYAGLSVTEFLDNRFVKDRRARKINGTYRYTAYFNDVNFNYLLRPTIELQNFCAAQGGSAVRTHVHQGNPVGRYFTSPLLTGMQTEAYARSRGASEPIAGRASIIAMQDQHELNTRMGEHESRRDMRRQLKEFYGTWECRDASGTSKWAVSVLPVLYSPEQRQSDHLILARQLVVLPVSLIEITPVTR